MVVGALVYDAGVIGLNGELAHRLPIVFCFFQAITAFLISLRFQEINGGDKAAGFMAIFKQTWRATKWVFTTKVAILIVVGGLLIDGVVRNFATINSEYYRLIEIPTYTFGFIAAGAAMLGIYVPRLSRYLVGTYTPLTNFVMIAGWCFFCLYTLGQTWVHWGVVPGIGVMAGMSHLRFLMSRYLNGLADSSQRATVLSVKGLLFNVGYGTASLVFAGTVFLQKMRNLFADFKRRALHSSDLLQTSSPCLATRLRHEQQWNLQDYQPQKVRLNPSLMRQSLLLWQRKLDIQLSSKQQRVAVESECKSSNNLQSLKMH